MIRLSPSEHDPDLIARRVRELSTCYIFGSKKNTNISTTEHYSSQPVQNTSPANEASGDNSSATTTLTPTFADVDEAEIGVQNNIQQVNPGFVNLLESADRLFNNAFQAHRGTLDIFQNTQRIQAAERDSLADERRLAATSPGTRNIATLIREAIVPIAIGAVIVGVTGKKWW